MICQQAEDCDDGLTGDFELTSTSDAVRWVVDDFRAASEPNSLYFGNPSTRSYEVPYERVAGSVTTPELGLPLDRGPVTLSFRLFLDVEPLFDFDPFEVRVIEGQYQTVVWTKAAVSGLGSGSWNTILVDLSSFAGRNVRLQWAFDSVDAIHNGTEGIYLDNLLIETSCPWHAFLSAPRRPRTNNSKKASPPAPPSGFVSPVLQPPREDHEPVGSWDASRKVSAKCRESLAAGTEVSGGGSGPGSGGASGVGSGAGSGAGSGRGSGSGSGGGSGSGYTRCRAKRGSPKTTVIHSSRGTAW